MSNWRRDVLSNERLLTERIDVEPWNAWECLVRTFKRTPKDGVRIVGMGQQWRLQCFRSEVIGAASGSTRHA
jgi:hypothetical protein